MKLLVTCPSCGAEIELQDIAPGTVVECPACRAGFTVPAPPPARPVVREAPEGRAPSAPRPERPAPRHTTIERTDKKWKVLDLVGALIVFGSIAACCATPRDPGGPMVWLCVGLVVWGVGRFGAWWTNG